jgi:putative SOS response-associated peptidase YedK
MCNLYSQTKSPDAMRRLFGVVHDRTGNLPPLSGIFLDQLAPVIRTARDGQREAILMRWGFPPPPNLGSRPVTNIRNVNRSYWRGWLKPDFRCLVPVTSFCEYTDSLPKVAHWFARDASRPLCAFAGLWRPWTGARGTKNDPVTGEHWLFVFLTTAANDDIRRIHAKAMPVVLTQPDEFERWLTAPVEEALKLQRPLPTGVLRIVATGVKEDVIARWRETMGNL